MISLANIAEPEHLRRNYTPPVASLRSFWRSGYGEPHRIPGALSRRPGAAIRVAEIAERLQNVLLRKLAFMTW